MLKPYNRQTPFIQRLIDKVRDAGLDFDILHEPFTVQKLDNTVLHLLIHDTYYSKVQNRDTLVIEYNYEDSKEVHNVLEDNDRLYCDGYVERVVGIEDYQIYPHAEFYLIHN